jgi:cation diffusion facilitator CzcD-associated flavoprotein CzcO
MPDKKNDGLRVAIIGAGLGGVAAAVNLKRAGISSFTIFEQSAGPGGTWWDNTYPGAECDIPIAFYSYSFKPHDWARTHASQAEIQAYIQSVIDDYDIGPNLRFNTRVTDAVWDDQRHLYTLTTAAGERMTFNVVISALGLLNVPRYPDWPGLERFCGPKFHTARWEHQHDLAGKDVIVVGIGSTAAQVVPAVAQVAGKVTMFAREPAYVMPKNERFLTEEERKRLSTRWGRLRERARLFWNIERGMSVRNPDSKRQKDTRAAFLRYRDEVFQGRPDLVEKLTPDYPFACKRPVGSTDFFPALTRENVEVVPRAVVSVTPDGVVDHTGVEHKGDVLVMATGFQPWNFLANLNLVGRGGRRVHGVWGDEPDAFLGIQVAGFPNFFMLYGPNTNYFCVTFMLERQAEFIARALKRMIRTGSTAIEVRRSVMDMYNRWVDRALSSKTLEANCNNYYHTATGKNVVTWPWRGTVYLLATRFGGLASFTRRVGEDKTRTRFEPGRSRAAKRSAPDLAEAKLAAMPSQVKETASVLHE